VASLFGIEAFRLQERVPKIVFAALAVVFALSAVLVNPIAEFAPGAAALVTITFDQPSSWLVLFTALFFILRPFWTTAPPVVLEAGALAPPYDDTDIRVAIRALGEGFAKGLRDLGKEFSDSEKERLEIMNEMGLTIKQQLDDIEGKQAEFHKELKAWAKKVNSEQDDIEKELEAWKNNIVARLAIPALSTSISGLTRPVTTCSFSGIMPWKPDRE
jgi:hypothetical protein